MPEPYAPKPPRGPLGDRVAAVPPEERAKVKAQILAEYNQPRTFDRDGIRYTLKDIKLQSKKDGRLLDDPQGDVLHVYVAATKLGPGGGPLLLDNPFLFVNPPFLVPDGTWRREMGDRPDGSTGLVDVANAKEDPVAALETIIVRVVG